jgi:hypothetical protein
VVVVDLAPEQGLGRADDALAPGEHAIDPISGVVPERQADRPPLTVGPAEGPLVQFVVFLRGPVQKFDLVAVKHPAGNMEPPGPVLADGGVGQDARHGSASDGREGIGYRPGEFSPVRTYTGNGGGPKLTSSVR